MTDKARIAAKIRAAANEAVAEYGFNDAVEMLDRIKAELSKQQWDES